MKKIRICPRCGSINVFSDNITDRMGIGLINYRCYDCEFNGQIFPEIYEEEAEKFRKNIKSRKKIN